MHLTYGFGVKYICNFRKFIICLNLYILKKVSLVYIKKIIDMICFNFLGSNDNFIYYYGFPMKTLKYIFTR